MEFHKISTTSNPAVAATFMQFAGEFALCLFV